MQFFYNNDIVNEIVDKLFRHRRSDYSQFNLENMLAYLNVIHQILPVINQQYEKIFVSLFQAIPQTEVCILFMHGYGSNRLECCNILRALKQPYSLCAFDFSGSGKSEGDRVTYGVKQKQDIHCTLNFLRKGGYKKFILWGRSMGATASLLYCIKYKPDDVILQIADSPFYSFETIAFQIANRNVKAPQFVISFALQMAKKNCRKFENNPFNIKLQNVGECTIPALFVYCEEDNIINYQNTQKICALYRSSFEKLVIQQNHNIARTLPTIEKIFSFIYKYYKKNSQKCPETKAKSSNRQSKLGLSQLKSSFINQNQKNREKSRRKGIDRIVHGKSQISSHDDYGTWSTSNKKIQFSQIIETPQGPRYNLEKFKTPKAKRSHLSITSSFSVKNQKTQQFSASPSFFNREGSTILNYRFEKTQGDQLKPKLSSVRSFGGSRYSNNIHPSLNE